MSTNKNTTECLDCLKPGAGNDKHVLIVFNNGSICKSHTWKVGTDPGIIKEDIISILVQQLIGNAAVENIASKLKALNLTELLYVMENIISTISIAFIPAGDMNKLITITGLLN